MLRGRVRPRRGGGFATWICYRILPPAGEVLIITCRLQSMAGISLIPRRKVFRRSRVRSTMFLLPAWFAPTSSLRVAFHRARGAVIGENVEIGYLVILDNLYPEKVIIEKGATVAARSTILAHDEALSYTFAGPERVAVTRVCEGAFIGVHCVVLPGIRIGRSAIVAAGSVVTSDVPDRGRVAGVPARPLPFSTEKHRADVNADSR